MINKKCPSCIQVKKQDSNNAVKITYVCKSNGYKICNVLECPHNRDNYEDNYGSYD